jgi:hypothetical protein
MILPSAVLRGRCAAVAALLLQAACSGEASAPAPLVMFDSAGVRIVESRAPSWQPGEAWTVAPDPALAIGEVEGDAAYLLSGILGAVRLSDGRVVVANGGSNEVRVYDPAGGYLSSLDGGGNAGGEFDRLASVYRLPGDSLAAWDGALNRLTVFTPQGDVSRQWTVTDLAVVVPPIIGIFNDGTLLSSTVRGGATGAPVEEYRDTTLWVRIRPGTTRMDIVGRSLGPEQMIMSSASSTQSYEVLFGRASLAAAASDRWFAAETGAYEIRVSSPSGELAAILRRPIEPQPVTSTVLAVRRDALLAEHERSEAAVRRFTEEQGGTYTVANSLRADDLPYREALPFFDRLLVDEQGNLWVRSYLVPGESRQVWSVFDRPGRWLGDLETPAGLDVLSIGAEYVLGRVRDDSGVESVRLHRLVKPAAVAGSA